MELFDIRSKILRLRADVKYGILDIGKMTVVKDIDESIESLAPDIEMSEQEDFGVSMIKNVNETLTHKAKNINNSLAHNAKQINNTLQRQFTKKNEKGSMIEEDEKVEMV